jgi:hypothetical protein
MYQDMLAKASFHKERIIKEFIKHGVFPTDSMISTQINNIDTALSIFKHEDVLEGSTFDGEEFNKEFKSIYEDLKILYVLLYKLTVEEYTSLKAFVDTHLDELESSATMYKLKAIQEASSSALGRTIFFQHNSFDIDTDNNVNVIDLGSVSLLRGSRVACFINANNIEPDRVVFKLENDTESISVSPYNYNQDSILIPGDINKNSFDVTINEDQIINGPVELDIDTELSQRNLYVVLAGKDNIMTRSYGSNSQSIYEKPTQTNMMSFDNKTYIDFYVVGGNKITFRFNKKPLSTNFPLTDYQVSNLKEIHHFFIEAEEGFAFDFELDQGTVYAVKENGVINNDKLYFARTMDIRDFHVVEYKLGDKVDYNVSAIVYNDDGANIDIESITIKELLSIGGAV